MFAEQIIPAYQFDKAKTQYDASYVGAILVIAHPPKAKTSFAPTEKRSHESENRSNVQDRSLLLLCVSIGLRKQ